MKTLKLLSIISALILIFSSCSEEKSGSKNIISSMDYLKIVTKEVTNISANGAKFNAELSYKGTYNIINYGFVWSHFDSVCFDSSDRIVIPYEVKLDTFSVNITAALSHDSYYVRAFISVSDSIIFGNQVTFISLGSQAPEIGGFYPKSGGWKDTLNIYGKKFSYVKNTNLVKLGNTISPIVYASDTLLSCIIPSIKNNDSVKVSVSIYGNYSISDEYFYYLKPEITDVYPLLGNYNDTLNITGTNFSKHMELVTVQIDDKTAEIISFDTSQLTIVVPEELTKKENVIKLSSAGYIAEFNQPFVLKPPIIFSFEPDTVTKLNEVVLIHGNNFSPIWRNNEIKIGGKEAEVLWSAQDELAFFLPPQILTFYNVSEIKDVIIEVTVAEQTDTTNNCITVNWHSTWTRKNDFPGLGRHNAVAFAINNKGYFGTGVTQNAFELLNDFWEYNPVTDQWFQITDFPGNPRARSVSFAIDNKGYVGLGYWIGPNNDLNLFRDFYCYNPLSSSWTRVLDFQGVGRHSAACFVINNEAFVGTGWWGNDAPYGNLQTADDVWKYDPISNSWVELNKFPNQTSKAVGFKIGNKGHFYDYNFLYVLEDTIWIKLTAKNLGAWDNIAFTINNFAYFGLGLPHQVGGTNDLWQYDPLSGNCINKPIDPSNKRWGASVFVINNKAYIIGGATYSNSLVVFKDVWEFDPSKPEL